MSTPAPRRPIRSFALRQGRLTQGQRRAWEQYWNRYGLEDLSAGSGELASSAMAGSSGAAIHSKDGWLNPAAAFGRDAPLVLEIGFGMGQSLAAQAAANPGINYLGVEVHRPGVGRLLRLIEEQSLPNIRIYCGDAVAVLEARIPDAALAGAQIFFPDPWPKKRHRKRRLVQPPFLSLLARKLRPGAFLHLATDWQDYADQMQDLLSAHPAFRPFPPSSPTPPARPSPRPPTKFEQRGRRLGLEVRDLLFQRTDTPVSKTTDFAP